MQYKSPIKALTPFLRKNETLEEIDLNNLKKRILAEFELSGKSSIRTKSGEFSKNEILKTIEEVKSSEDFRFHTVIAQFPQLINLLEEGKLTEAFSFQDPAFKDPKFVEFLSPFVAFALGQYYSSYLKDSKRYMTYTLQKDLPVLPKDEHLIIEPVYQVFETIFQKIESVSSNIGKSKELVDARIYFTNNRIRVINHLPRKYFSHAIDVYVTAGFNLLARHLRNRDKYRWYEQIATEIFSQLKKVRGKGEVYSNILQLSQYFDPVEPDEDLKDNSGCSITFRIVGIIFFIIVFLARLGAC